MKKSVKRSLETKIEILAIACLFLIIPACDPIEIDINDPKKPKAESFNIGPEGGIINALEGNVTIDIPKDALVTSEKFTIELGPEDDGNDFIIKSIIVIPQTVKFKKPVGLRLKYDGQLSCGLDPFKATSPVLYHFKDDAKFDKRGPSDMLWKSKCYVNQMDCCIETIIYSGGVFAIGEESLGQKAPDPS